MGAVLAFTHNLTTCTCYKCGIQFAVPQYFDTKRLEDRETFYCPNGHGQSYSGKSADQKRIEELERAVASEKRSKEYWIADSTAAKESAAAARKQASAMKGQVTKIKNRVGNGVCPCCNRTFQNLLRHMGTQHPEFKQPEA